MFGILALSREDLEATSAPVLRETSTQCLLLSLSRAKISQLDARQFYLRAHGLVLHASSWTSGPSAEQSRPPNSGTGSVQARDL